MKIGYARVSTLDQEPELQVRALEAAGCERIFTDQASGADRERPALAKALGFVRQGDEFLCWKLDRVARSLSHLLEVTDRIRERGASFVSLTESIDTSSSIGGLMFHLLGAFAEFERSLIRERTLAGLAVARSKGRVGGSKPLLTAAQAQRARQMKVDGMTHDEAAKKMGISRAALYANLRRYNGVQH